MKVRITKIGKYDAFYRDRKVFIGVVGTVTNLEEGTMRGYSYADFIADRPIAVWGEIEETETRFTFAAFKFEEVQS